MAIRPHSAQLDLTVEKTAGIHNQLAVWRPHRTGGLTRNHGDWFPAFHLDLEQAWPLRVSATGRDPSPVWRPVRCPLPGLPENVEGSSQRSCVRPICRHDGQVSFPLLSDDDAHAKSIP